MTPSERAQVIGVLLAQLDMLALRFETWPEDFDDHQKLVRSINHSIESDLVREPAEKAPVAFVRGIQAQLRDLVASHR